MQETTRLPGAMDLYSVLSRVLEDFAYLTVMPIETEAPQLPICFKAELPEQQGWLVLRGTVPLARQLAEASTGGTGDGLEEDAFIELCNLSTSHLVSQHWQGKQHAWKAFVPQAGLPDGICRSRLLLDVEGNVLEASIWKAA